MVICGQRISSWGKGELYKTLHDVRIRAMHSEESTREDTEVGCAGNA